MAELVVLTAGVAAIIGAIAWHLAQMMWANRLMLRRKVIVNLQGDQAIAGVLWARRGGLLVLKQAQLHEPGVDPVPMDGDVVIERSRVDFVQVAG